MRVSELRSAIEGIRRLFDAGGAASAGKDLGKVSELLSAQNDRDLDDYLGEVKVKLAPPPPPSAELHLARLKDAGFDESRFNAALASLRADKKLSKPTLEALASDYGVIRLSKNSKPAIIESIEKHFYWTLNNRDADALARRATPW